MWIEQEKKLIIHHCLDKHMTAPRQQIMIYKYMVSLVTLAVDYDFDNSLMVEHFPSATESMRC